MDKVILIRYGELYLKGKNRNFFERLLINNIKFKLSQFKCKLFFGRNRYIVSEFLPCDEGAILLALTKIFGIHSVSSAHVCPSTFEDISKLSITLCAPAGSFRVNANRADKRFPLTSVQLCKDIGGIILESNSQLKVDLHNPDFTVNIDVREDGKAFVYRETISCAGGLPVGSAGKGLLLLSGGIDSPVAAYMMAKRGLYMDALHFHSYPYTSEQAKQKVVELRNILTDYCGRINLICAPFTKIQEAIHKFCDESYMITILRRFMMRVSEIVAISRDCGCIINGESLGQVASQTLESINVTNATVKTLPVFRPLIGMDKQEIISISEKIGTYKTSILPFEDCCTVFLPENPATRPSIKRAEAEESKIPNYNELIEEVINNLEIIKI